MSKKQMIIVMFAAFFCLVSTGVVFASETSQGKIGTEAGNWEFNFDTPNTKADIAAQSYNYNPEALTQVGSEAGNWEFQFEAPESKADIAAKNHIYDQESLADIGSEAWCIGS